MIHEGGLGSALPAEGDLIEIFTINGHARFRIDHQEVYDLKHGSMYSATYLESDNPTDEVDLYPMFSAARPPWLHFCTVRADECTASEHDQQLFHVGKWRFILESELEVALDSAAGAAAAGAGGPTAPPAAKGAGGGVSIVQAVPNGKDDLRDKLVALRARVQGPPLPPPAFPPPGELASAGQGRRAGSRGYGGSEEPPRKHPRVEGAAVLGKGEAGASRGPRDRSLGASKRHGLAEAIAAKGIQAASGRRDSPHRSRERAARGERGRSRSRRGSRHRRRSRYRSPSRSSSGSRSRDFPEGRRSKREQVRATMERRPGRITERLLAKMRAYLPRESRPGSATEPVAMRYLTTQLIPRLGSELNKRNEAELRTLATCLDCLLDGNFVGCTDLLAQQFKAVEMAQREGWAAAQHLNPLHDTLVSAMEEDEREELYRAEQQEMKREELNNRSPPRAGSGGGVSSGSDERGPETGPRARGSPAQAAGKGRGKKGKGLVGGVGIGVLGELLLGFARQGSACKSRAGAPSSWGESCSPSSSRELLPFATSLGLAPYRQHAEYARLLAGGDKTGRCALPRPALGLDEWLLLVLLGLNALWDGSRALGQQPCAMPVNGPSVAQVACFWHLERKVHSFVTTPGMGVAAEAPVELFAKREVSYGGDVVQRAVELTWEQIEPALPPADRCGRLRAVDFCKPRVRRYLEEPIEMLVPLDCFPARPKPGKVMASSTEIVRIGRGLLERGLVAPLRRSDLLHIHGEPVVNGLFGALKDDLVPSGPSAGQPQLRLIMNLTASNQLMGELPLDIAKLPFYAQWRNIIIDVGEELVWAHDDMKGAFYLFSLPPQWAALFCFDVAFDPLELGIRDWGDEPIWLGATTVPMGWCNAMGLFQYLHRRLLISGGVHPRGLPLRREIRKDRPFPVARSGDDEFDQLWQIYCDDADYGKLISKQERWHQHLSQAACFSEAARARYDEWAVPISAKSGTNCSSVSRLGALLDGADGRLRLTPKRVGLLTRLSCHCIASPAVRRKHLEIVIGHWVHAASYRKECMSCFQEVWHVLSHWSGGPRALPEGARRELLLALALLPCFEYDLRSPISRVMTASDASENGGGVTYTSRHTAEGRTAALCELAGGCAHGRDLLVLLEVGGCGRGRMAFDSVGLELSLHGLLSVTPDAARTVRARWPEAEVLGDLRAFDAIAARRLLGRAAHATDLVFMCHIGSALELDADLPLICSAQRVLQREGAGLRVWPVCLAAPSTSREQLESVTRAFRSIPLFMDVSTVSESTGCEYCWLSWPLEGGSHLRMSRQPDRIFLSWSESTPAAPPAAAGAGLRSTGARRGARSCPLGKECPAGAAQRGCLQCIALRLGFPHDFFLQARSRKSGCTSEALDQARHAVAAQCGPVAPLAYLVGLWGQINSRFVHILDSQVCIGVLCKGRSSVWGLQKILARIVSLLLAGSLHPHWVYVRSADNPADAVADYLEALWDDGSPRSLAADTLSGLQHLVPSLRRELKEGWRLLRTWDQNEMPSRAPPLRPEVAIALAGFALADGREDVATAILAGFNGLLRPSEMLISAGDCVFDHSQRTCVVNLGLTKGGKRQGCPEDVIIDDEFAYLLLRRALAGCAAGTALLPRGLANFRASFASYLGKAGLDPSRIKPYSIRRGGATHHFSSLGNMALTCERGRWRSRATAKIYITEGVAALEAVAVTKQQRAALALGHQLFHRHIERIMDGGK
ncbi:unnamed protein product [Prorocentrum cordatum]|uniref:Uncharacterized protein n=1 Tax=Prorocentrum cordatum TaxID=2364126 RepID=A0ABN9QB36_9DINO|nr:unnamed protein product [Polarella glacialis]